MVTSAFYDLPNTGLFKAIGERLTEAEVTGTPVPNTAATASVTFTYFSETRMLFVAGSFSALQGTLLPGGANDVEGNAASGIDISLAASGSTGPLVRNLAVVSTGVGRGTFNGLYELTAAEEAAYFAGDLYVTARTETRPDGELRGQIDSIAAAALTGSLDQPMTPEEITPPIKTPEDPGTGIASAWYDTASNSLVVRGTYDDLSSDLAVRGETDPEGNEATAIHLHSAEAGANGGVERNLLVEEGAGNSGTFRGDYTLRPGAEINFLNGESYTFIHTVVNFGGELRGQLDDFVIFTPFAGTAGNDTNLGDATNDVMLGRAGNDQLSGGLGDDVLDGGTGADTLDGGAGDDAFVLDAAGDVLVEAALGGADTVQSSIDHRLGANIEHLILTGTAVVGIGNNLANHIVGNAVANRLSGGAGNDTLRGGNGADNLNGGSGADTLIGGEGDDLYSVDDLGDVVVEAGMSTADRVMASVSFALSDGVEMLTLTGTAATTGTGNGLANRMAGNGADNALLGGAGNDTMLGGAGNDTLTGGLGVDRLFGELGADRFHFATVAEAGDVIYGFASGTDGLQVSAAGFGGGLSVGALVGDQFIVAGNGQATAAHGQFIFDGVRLVWDADGTGAGSRQLVAILADSTGIIAADIAVIG